MRIAKKLKSNFAIIENIIFVCGFGFIMYHLLSTYGRYIYQSVRGGGLVSAIITPLLKHQYYGSFISLMVLLNATFVLWEIFAFVIPLLRHRQHNGAGDSSGYKAAFKKMAVNYKSSFLALLVHEFLPKVILLHMFWAWLPHFQRLQPFTINLQWYSWIYGYLCWEFSSWLFHFSSHRVRVLWCLHSPHHAPTELNMTVNWIHFFAESYYSTFVRLVILLAFGVNPAMFMPVILIDSAWGIFIHVSERALKDGRLGIFQHLIITPAHHRVHHAKNPLYLDTNFANVLPIWDWLLGTLQPLREEVKTDYGLLRDLDVTNFSDLYFGELMLLYRDIKNAAGIKNKVLYTFMPPGWTPTSSAETAPVLRQKFLKSHPALGLTSKNCVLAWIRSAFRSGDLNPSQVEAPVPVVVEVIER